MRRYDEEPWPGPRQPIPEDVADMVSAEFATIRTAALRAVFADSDQRAVALMRLKIDEAEMWAYEAHRRRQA